MGRYRMQVQDHDLCSTYVDVFGLFFSGIFFSVYAILSIVSTV